MFKDKYPTIFSGHANGGYCVYYPSNFFHNPRGFEYWGMSVGYSQVLAGEYSVT